MPITRHEPSEILSNVVEANGFVFTAGVVAEDATQDAMLTVLTSLDKYTPRAEARFAAWVMTIAVNTARRRFRRRRP